MERLFGAAMAALPLFALAAAAPARAENFPPRQIGMIVVSAPGGATDVQAHLAAGRMSRTLDQRVVVESVTGAGGAVGGARGTQARPTATC